MMQIKFHFNNFIFDGVCLPQLGSVPAAYAVVAGGCDWPMTSFPYVLYVACVALDGCTVLFVGPTPALTPLLDGACIDMYHR